MTDVVVVVPARDEEAGICATLRSVCASLDEARARGLVDEAVVEVTAHRCLDTTEARARAVLRGRPEGRVVRDDRPTSVGQVRDEAARRGLAALPGPASRTWVLSTDADTHVGTAWVGEILREAARTSALAVVGLAPLDAWHGGEEGAGAYADLLAAKMRTEDRDALHQHDHVYGANLAVRADAYLDVGGFPHAVHGEDRALLDALRSRPGPGAAHPLDRGDHQRPAAGSGRGGLAEHLARARRRERAATTSSRPPSSRQPSVTTRKKPTHSSAGQPGQPGQRVGVRGAAVPAAPVPLQLDDRPGRRRAAGTRSPGRRDQLHLRRGPPGHREQRRAGDQHRPQPEEVADLEQQQGEQHQQHPEHADGVAAGRAGSAAPSPTSAGPTYPAAAVSTIPGPLARPFETVSPEVSECSRMPGQPAAAEQRGDAVRALVGDRDQVPGAPPQLRASRSPPRATTAVTSTRPAPGRGRPRTCGPTGRRRSSRRHAGTRTCQAWACPRVRRARVAARPDPARAPPSPAPPA